MTHTDSCEQRGREKERERDRQIEKAYRGRNGEIRRFFSSNYSI